MDDHLWEGAADAAKGWDLMCASVICETAVAPKNGYRWLSTLARASRGGNRDIHRGGAVILQSVVPTRQ